MDAAAHLDALAAALHAAGWASSRRDEPAILHVVPPTRPEVGESVRVLLNDAGCWCFVDSYGRELGLCSDVAAAAEAMDKWLAATVGR